MSERNDNGHAPEVPGAPPKVEAEQLTLHTRPRPISRINRRVLLAFSATALGLMVGMVVFALDPPRIFKKGGKAEELYRADNPPKPEGLENLPRRYSDLPGSELSKSDLLKPVPKLGPPLPGDLGTGVLSAENDLGIAGPPRPPFRPDPEEDAARAERIRQARLAQQGRESKVFFQLGSGTASSMPKATSSAGIPSRNAPSLQNAFNVAGGSNMKGASATDRAQGFQARKLAFLNQRNEAQVVNAHALRDPASPYQLMAGTIIPASLITGINSDLPGKVIAQVTENVYDTVSGRHLLIPQGARVIGKYDSVIAFGQNRALIIWQRIIMPDGSSISIDNLPATDTAGYAGLKDEVDLHTWQLLKGVVLSTLLGVSSELTFGKEESDLLKAIRQSSQKSVNQAGQRLVERSLDIQPTITIRPGWPLRIIVHSDLILRPYGAKEGQP